LHRWSAVVRGAATAGLEGGGMIVQHRKCRRHYGIVCSNAFVVGKHKAEELFICAFTGDKRANGQMSWIINKSDELVASKAVHATQDFEKSFWPREKKTMEVKLYASERDEAPQRSDDDVGYWVFS
jgi:hypothetical protein